MSISPEVFARYAEMHVPRYTSYPTAPNFSPAHDDSEYRRWLARVPAGEPVSVYVHIPFCPEMCWYCGCHTSVTRRQAPVSRYLDALLAEVGLVARELPQRTAIGHLHLGGGSPTLLAAGDVARLREALDTHFGLAQGAELAVEVDPRTLTADLARAFGQAGINRASLGVQSFDEQVQRAINRIQSFRVTAEAATRLRGHGVRGINIDLVYGLPFQTVASCVDTVRQALLLAPARLAVFGYAHVPGFKPHQRKIDPAALPRPAQRQEQFRAMAELLVAEGYVQVGLDHFALPGDPLAVAARDGVLRRNFQGYTTDGCATLLGLGASAIGRLPHAYVQNAVAVPDYLRRIREDRLAVVRSCRVSSDDRRRAAIIEQLMCAYRANVSGVRAPLERLEADGLIRRRGNVIELAEEARPLVCAVAAAFDAYLPTSAASHAVAV